MVSDVSLRFIWASLSASSMATAEAESVSLAHTEVAFLSSPVLLAFYSSACYGFFRT